MRPEDINNPDQGPIPSAGQREPFPVQPQSPVSNFSVPGIPEPSYGSGLMPSLPDVNMGGFGPVRQRQQNKRKLFAVSAALLVVLLGSSAAAYYGFVIPNKPESVWKTALTRTSQGYDKLVSYQEQHPDVKGVTAKGNFKASGEFATDGTFELQSYDKDATFKFDVGAITTRVNVEGRLIGTENSKNPDIYLKASGLKGASTLVGEEYGQFLERLDDQWYAVDHTLLDNLESQALKQDGAGINSAAGFTANDAVQVQKAIAEVNRQYVFTTDPNKAVLSVVKNVGKQQRDGRAVYHYEVGLHKQHTKDYANALVDRLQNTPVTKFLDGKKLRDVIAMSELTKSIDSYSETDTADVYVDMATKLVRTIRIQDKKDAANYVELTMPYTGGDTLPVVLTVHGKDDTDGQAGGATFKLNTDLGQYKGDMSIDFTLAAGGGSKASETGNFKMTFSENKTALKVEKPTGAKSLNGLLSGLLGSFNSGDNAATSDLIDVTDDSSSI